MKYGRVQKPSPRATSNSQLLEEVLDDMCFRGRADGEEDEQEEQEEGEEEEDKE